MKNSIQIIILLLLTAACVAEKTSNGKVEAIISNIKTRAAPDKRVALFDIETRQNGRQIILKGETNLPDAAMVLRDSLQNQNIAFVDSISLLPEASLGRNIYGVVKLSVANIRSEPQHAAELATQALLGTPLNVLKKEGGWYLVQTPDKYISWIDWGGLQLMNREAFEKWQAAEKLIVVKPFGFLYDAPSNDAATIGDLVMGNIMELDQASEGFFSIKLPDGRAGFVKETGVRYLREWVGALKPTPESLVNTSFAFKGLPYLWGGTSFKGVDCSGFTKTVFFMNGLIIPRDASQQIHTGKLVDATGALDKLIPGDLLFFGTRATDSAPEKVVHVGIWIGNNEFIHASGNVHVGSMDSTASNFDAYNYKRYLRTKRLLNQEDENLIQLKESDFF